MTINGHEARHAHRGSAAACINITPLRVWEGEGEWEGPLIMHVGSNALT